MNITSHQVVSTKPDTQQVNQKSSIFRKVEREELYRNILQNSQVNATAVIAFGIVGAAIAAGVYLAWRNHGVIPLPSKCLVPTTTNVQVQPSSVQSNIQCPATLSGISSTQCSTDIRYVPQIKYVPDIRYVRSNMTNLTVFDPKYPPPNDWVISRCYSLFPELQVEGTPETFSNRMSSAVKNTFEGGGLIDSNTPTDIVKSSAGNLSPGLVTAVATVAAIVLNLM